MKKTMMTLLLAFCMLLGASVVAGAVEDVPKEVVDGRNGVFRIVVTADDGGGTGTGFAVGTEKKYYIITNYHVIYDMDDIYVMYDNEKYVTASVLYASPSRDLAILEPDKSIPNVKVLPLETGKIDTGMAVYALGFSGASDALAQGFDVQYNSPKDMLRNVIADKESMTITNGIISAIIDSSLVGIDPGSGNTARLIQTNTAINRGNSGGPLLNKQGHVVGVNTLGISGVEWHIEAMNGSIHVDELIRELRNQGIRFETSSEEVVLEKGGGASGQTSPVAWIVVVVGVVVAAGLVVWGVVLMKRRGARTSGAYMDLMDFERKGQPMPPLVVLDATGALIRQLMQAGSDSDSNTLLTPGNIIIRKNTLELARTKVSGKSATKLELYPGYSAPENYRNRAGGQAGVYFTGAVMATLLTGNRPEEALSRMDSKDPIFKNPKNPIESIINRATNPEESKRTPSLQQLLQEIEGQRMAMMPVNPAWQGTPPAQTAVHTAPSAGMMPGQPAQAQRGAPAAMPHAIQRPAQPVVPAAPAPGTMAEEPGAQRPEPPRSAPAAQPLAGGNSPYPQAARPRPTAALPNQTANPVEKPPSGPAMNMDSVLGSLEQMQGYRPKPENPEKNPEEPK